jgi:lipid II:glycine glycyltransferase (peptidoglycan interpeptide bridge formation enzyme)
MKIKIKEISAQVLDKFYDQFTGEKTFLQTPKFGLWRTTVGEKIFRFGIFEEDKLIGTAQIQKIKTKFKTFLHLPHGPLLDEKNNEAIAMFLDFYRNFGKQEKCDFVRLSPCFGGKSINQITGGLTPLLSDLGYRPAPVHLINPEKTWVLNIEKDLDEILKNMRKSTRYEINRIEKCDIKTRMGNSKEDLEFFWQLHQETFARNKFVPFPKKNTARQLEIFGKNCQIFSAEIDGKFYSSSIILFDKKAAYYHQGASIRHKFPVAHATIWAAIIEAKKRGCKEFNFWGVCDENEKNHPWTGLSKFKRGFGGEERNFMHVHDAPITNKYWLNCIIEKWRKWKKNY